MTESKADTRLHYDDIAQGLTWETPAISITESQILAFAGLSGDFFDIHVDDEYGRSLGYPSRVAHGLMGLAMMDGLKYRAGVRLATVVSLGWRWKFVGPLLPGDRVRGTVRVASKRTTKRTDRGIVTLEMALINQNDDVIQQGENDLMVVR